MTPILHPLAITTPPAILKTRNYDMFRHVDINRPIRNVKSLVDSLATVNVQACTPIVVTPDYRILEGQHRLAACKELDVPVFYVICDVPEEMIETVILLLNKNQKTWSITDYINLQATKGVGCYSNFRDWYTLNGFPVSVAMAIYSDTWIKARDIRNGIEFSKSDNADDIANFLHSPEVLQLRFRHSKHFVYAVRKAIETYTPRQIKKLRNKILQISRAGDTQGYINQFQNLLKL